jgi:hypothetical protein
MTPGSRNHRRNLLLFLLLPPIGAAPVAALADLTRPTATLLLLEPVLLAFGIYGVASLAFRTAWSRAGALALGLTLAVAVLHAPVGGSSTPPLETSWSSQVGRCAHQTDVPSAPLRVLQWDLSGADPSRVSDVVLALRPDIAVLTHLATVQLLTHLGDSEGGEIRYLGAEPDGIGLFVRGAFQYCGRNVDAWVLDPEVSGGDAVPTSHFAALTFPRVQGVGLFPLIAFSVDHDVLGTSKPSDALDIARIVASASDLLGASLVVAGHAGGPPTWRHAASFLHGSGLDDAGGPATWPGRFGPLPGLTWLRLDRVLAGSFWQPDGVATAAIQTPNRPILVELGPSKDALQAE